MRFGLRARIILVLQRNIPSRHEVVITFVNGEPFRRSPPPRGAVQARLGRGTGRPLRKAQASRSRRGVDARWPCQVPFGSRYQQPRPTGADDTVAIGTSAADGEARLWVRDTGRGIPISDQARIFDRFSRGRDAHRRYRGGGLGLAIVKAIAEAHGGRVELESRLGEGSTFTIVVPRAHSESVNGGQDPDR